MQRPRILVTNRIHEEVIVRLAAVGEVEVNQQFEPMSPALLGTRLATADAMMGFMTDRVDRQVLAGAPRLQVVACALKGFDSYDVEACTDAGVWLTIVPDLLTEPTAELALGLAIALGRRILAADGHVRSGAFKGWRPHYYGTGLAGSVATIVGFGRVGQAIARRLRGFDCHVIAVDPQDPADALAPLSPLVEAIRASDYIFLALPLTAETRHLIGAAEFSVARPGSLWINVGRGSVVDERAAAAALTAGRIGGYAADVFEFEDWGEPRRPRDIDPELLQHPDTVLTPHIGSAVRSVRLAIEHRAADNILAVLEERTPPDAVNQPARRLRRA